MVSKSKTLKLRRQRRTYRVRNGIRSNSTRVVRLSVFRSNDNIYAQIIDDSVGRTICSASTLKMDARGGNIEAAREVGRQIAELAIAAGIKSATFDRGSYRYHGRVAAVADAARASGLEI